MPRDPCYMACKPGVKYMYSMCGALWVGQIHQHIDVYCNSIILYLPNACLYVCSNVRYVYVAETECHTHTLFAYFKCDCSEGGGWKRGCSDEVLFAANKHEKRNYWTKLLVEPARYI